MRLMERSVKDSLLRVGSEVAVRVQREGILQLLAANSEGAGVKDLELAGAELILHLGQLLGGAGRQWPRSDPS